MKIQDKYISFETHQLFGKRIAANFVLPVFVFLNCFTMNWLLLLLLLRTMMSWNLMCDVIRDFVPRYFVLDIGVGYTIYLSAYGNSEGLRVEVIPFGRRRGDPLNNVYHYCNEALGVSVFDTDSDSDSDASDFNARSK